MKLDIKALVEKARSTLPPAPPKIREIPESSDGNVLILGTPADKDSIPTLKGMLGGKTVLVSTKELTLLTELDMLCTHGKVKYIITTNTEILQRLVALRGEVSKPKLDDYAGSFFEYNDKEIVFINPTAQIYSIPYMRFLTNRYISKLLSPEKWPEPTEFNYYLLTAENIEETYEKFKEAKFISTDIETKKEGLRIFCVSYTAIFIGSNFINTVTVVLKLEDSWSLSWMRKFNQLDPDKIFQNGRYDNAYFLRYHSPPKNWFWDTAGMSHCLYSELPKDLGFQNAFWLRKVVYWKDLAETADLETYYRYCALDSWATANVAIQWFLQAPAWAKKNYFLEFPLNFPCLLSEMTGVIRDQDRLVKVRKVFDEKISKTRTFLEKSINVPGFNPNSPKQVVKLMQLLGDVNATSSNEKNINNLKYTGGPLAAHILDMVLDVRGWRKLTGTYLRLDSDANEDGEGGSKEYKGTWLYTQVPHNTDTARLSSGEHHFWRGANIQNVPIRDGPEVKETIKAPEGFWIAESDLSKAETWDTANIAGEENLLRMLNSPQDFHALNASAMSGIPYEKIFNDDRGKTVDKKIRDLFKRVNHGANYNMGDGVLVDTMGLKMVWEAKKILNLPFSKPKHITKYLLENFHDKYPQIKKNPGSMYASVVSEIGITNRITSRAFHHIDWNVNNYTPEQWIEEGDWTRYCFGDPKSSKTILNSVVAHPPQSLNARTLNEAVMQIFYKVALPYAAHFRLNAQIHDSVFFCWRQGHDYLPAMVRRLMEIPVTVKSVDGKYRTFTVPADLKLGKTYFNENNTAVVDDFGNVAIKYAKYWSDTE